MADWFPLAIRWDGAPWKMGYPSFGTSGPKRGDVKHSAEGTSWSAIHDILNSQRRASWHFTVGYDRVEQHYPISAHCWHAGDVGDDGAVRANIELVGIEHLGMAGESLTPYQIDATIAISEWCADQYHQDKFARYPDQVGVWTLVEHNQVSDEATACPSGRIPWTEIMLRLRAAEEDDMAYTLVLGRDPAEPGMIYVVYKDSAGHPLWKTHLKDFADMPKLGVTFPVVDMVELRSVGILPTRHV